MPNLGGILTEKLCSELGTNLIETTIGGSITTGALMCGNNSGIIVSSHITTSEKEKIISKVDLPVKEIPGPINAIGNVVLANDHGAYVHKSLTDEAISIVEEVLDVPAIRSNIAGIPTVGTAAVVTNNGMLCPPMTTDAEIEQLQTHFNVPAYIGSINYGGPLIGSGLVANIRGYVSGEDTTGPELGRIEETLGFLD
jgi:translation initiation factor 6